MLFHPSCPSKCALTLCAESSEAPDSQVRLPSPRAVLVHLPCTLSSSHQWFRCTHRALMCLLEFSRQLGRPQMPQKHCKIIKVLCVPDRKTVLVRLCCAQSGRLQDYCWRGYHSFLSEMRIHVHAHARGACRKRVLETKGTNNVI